MTQIVRNINIAVNELLNGNVVALPTETVYGLGANGLSAYSVLKIYETKRRPHFNPLIMHVSSVDDLAVYAKKIPDDVYKLAEKFTPGPITFVLKKKAIVPDIVTAGLDSVAIRIPAHKMFLEVLKKSGVPVAAPSANIFGSISPTTANDVIKELNGKINYILDGGKCKVGIESTVVSFTGGKPVILRPGFITQSQIEEVLGYSIAVKSKSSKKINSPGLLKHHYAPNTPMYITYDLGKLVDIFIDEGFIDLSKYKSLKSIASNLFKEFRKCDEKKFDFIAIEKVINTGLGIAINDRIEKASAGKIVFKKGKAYFIKK